ncbi:putative RNA methyltransferase At5g10620 [Hibiscus syriacus]|uniref:putative RNA methyltransferase At5g10620 n=1 Tax=Hibiscus syriacus TaxID=106335 RepID=UPI0019236139|nr:putative RNA methyltransferase At5g10620 [Hibiscus syriacus]
MVMAVMAVPISACGVTLQCTNCSSYSSGKECKYAGQSVRALPIKILTVGKARLPVVQLLVDEYIAKLKSYCHIDDVQICSNPKNAFNARAQVEDEDTAIEILLFRHYMLEEFYGLLGSGPPILAELRAIQIGLTWFVESKWCGKGKLIIEMDLEVVVKWIKFPEACHNGASRLSFCIGGPYGHGQQVRKHANVSIKLSSMVLNHQIALVVLMEQLFRSWTILKGQMYHH